MPEIEPMIWDGNGNCEHNFNVKAPPRRNRNKSDIVDRNSKEATKSASAYNSKETQFCSKCSAWKGSLGLEPTFDLFIKHLCDIFDEVKKVLKPTGTCWVNLGDTYSGSCCGANDYRDEASKSISGIGKNSQLYRTGGIA